MSRQVCVSTHDGQAAGRDIHNHHQAMVVLAAPPAPPVPTESQLQAEFAQRTGIWCSRPARQWLEQLLEHHGFTVRELEVCWKARSIWWDKKRNSHRIAAPWVESLLAYAMLVVVGLYGLATSALAFASAPAADKSAATAFFMVFVVLFGGVYFMVDRFMLWPSRVARQVQEVSAKAD